VLLVAEAEALLGSQRVALALHREEEELLVAGVPLEVAGAYQGARGATLGGMGVVVHRLGGRQVGACLGAEVLRGKAVVATCEVVVAASLVDLQGGWVVSSAGGRTRPEWAGMGYAPLAMHSYRYR
jgi:hypothetical protein